MKTKILSIKINSFSIDLPWNPESQGITQSENETLTVLKRWFRLKLLYCSLRLSDFLWVKPTNTEIFLPV